jgi:hypothetical protein
MSSQSSKLRIRNYFAADAIWGPRRETPAALAARFINLLDRLKAVDPVFDGWLWTDQDDQTVAFEEIKRDLPAAIDAKISRDDDGDPEPIYGYRFYVYNSIEWEPRGLSISVHGGCWSDSDLITNNVWISTAEYADPDPAIITFPIFKAAVLAAAETFDAIWSTAYSKDLMMLGLGPSYYRLGWISYVGPRFAHLITPPSSAIVERRPNGGLLMAATDEPFSVSNPAHVAAARDILAAVAPLAALPWPPDVEPADAG